MRRAWLAVLPALALGAGGGWLALRESGGGDAAPAAARDPLAAPDVPAAGAAAPASARDGPAGAAVSTPGSRAGRTGADEGGAEGSASADDASPVVADTIFAVITDGDGRLLEGVTIELARSGETTRAARTDASGYVEFTGLAPGVWQVTADAPGLPMWSGSAESGGPPLLIYLRDAFTIDVVVTASGSIGGYRILQAGLSRRHERGFETAPQPVEFAAPPERDGDTWRFRVRDVASAATPHGPRRVWVRGDAGRLGVSRWVTPVGRARHATAEVVLEAGRLVRGVVQTAEGLGVSVSGVKLQLASGPGQALGAAFASGADSEREWIRSDDDGRFELPAPAEGRFEVCIALSSKWHDAVPVPPDGTAIRYVIPTHAPPVRRLIAGVILDPDGRPLPGVTLEFPTGESPSADAQGRFEFASWQLGPGLCAVTVRDGGFVLGACSAVLAEESRSELSLRLDTIRRSRMLRLRLREGARPAAGWQIDAVPWSGAAARASTAIADVEGVAVLRVEPSIDLLVHVRRPDPPARASAAARRPSDRWLRVSGDGVEEIDVNIDPVAGGSLVGTVVDRAGHRLAYHMASARLVLEDAAAPVATVGASATMNDGRLVVHDLPPGRYWIVARGSQDGWPSLARFGPVQVGAGRTETEFRLEAPGRLSGRVLDGAGQPLHGATVRAVWPGWPDPPADHYIYEKLGQVETGPDGRYHLDRLPAGPIQLAVWLGQERVRVAGLEVPPGGTVWQDVVLR